MSKLRADSTWNGLTPEQREKLDEWLFEEGLSYPLARERVQKELGIECSISGVGRYYRRAVETRAVEKLAEAQDAATAVNRTGVKLKSLRSSALKVIGQRLLEKAMEGGDVKELVALGRLMTEEEVKMENARILAIKHRLFGKDLPE